MTTFQADGPRSQWRKKNHLKRSKDFLTRRISTFLKLNSLILCTIRASSIENHHPWRLERIASVRVRTNTRGHRLILIALIFPTILRICKVYLRTPIMLWKSKSSKWILRMRSSYKMKLMTSWADHLIWQTTRAY